MDRAGNVYVADVESSRIDRFNPSNFAGAFATYGSLGSGNGQFSAPSALALDNAGNLYVADLGNSRIVKLTGAAPVPEPSSILLLLGSGWTLLKRRRPHGH